MIEATLTSDERQLFTYVWSLAKGTNDTSGTISGESAAPILEASGLDQETLAEIWNICVEVGTGNLTFNGFCNFLRFIAQKQREQNPQLQLFLPMLNLTNFSTDNVNSNNALSTVVDNNLAYLNNPIESAPPMGHLDLRQNVDWSVTPYDKEEYIKLFNDHDLNNTGYIEGPQARELFSQSGLPDNVLYCIWNLCDRSKRGKLDLGEFIVASHIISKVLDNADMPTIVPPSLEVEFNPTHTLAADIFAGDSIMEPITNDNKNEIKKEIDFPETKIFDQSFDDPFGPDRQSDTQPNNDYNHNDYIDVPHKNDIDNMSLGTTSNYETEEKFKFKPSVKFNDDGMDPVAILSAAIESDRVLTQRVIGIADPIHEDAATITQLNRALVSDIKFHKEELQTQLVRLAAVEEEVSSLRSQYEELSQLRMKVINEVTCLKKDVSNVQDQKSFLSKAVYDCQTDLEFLTSLMSDIKVANDKTNHTLVETAKMRTEVVELIQLYDQKRKAEDLEIADLQMTYQRLMQEQQRVQSDSKNYIERFRQDSQDQNLINISLANSNKMLYKQSQNLIECNEMRTGLVHKVQSCISNSATAVNISPTHRQIRDKKGIPVSSNPASPVKLNGGPAVWQHFDDKTPIPALEPLTLSYAKSAPRNTGISREPDLEVGIQSSMNLADRHDSHMTRQSLSKFSDAKSHISGGLDSIFNRM